MHTWTYTHTCRHAGRQGTGQPIRPPQVPSRPLNRALMGCGIDIPSVTVSRWITVSGRETQKREEEARRREGRGERRRKRRRGRLRDQTRSSSKRASLCLSLRDSSLSWKKRLNPHHPPPSHPPQKKFFFTISLLSFLVVLLLPLPLSLC